MILVVAGNPSMNDLKNYINSATLGSDKPECVVVEYGVWKEIDDWIRDTSPQSWRWTRNDLSTMHFLFHGVALIPERLRILCAMCQHGQHGFCAGGECECGC